VGTFVDVGGQTGNNAKRASGRELGDIVHLEKSNGLEHALGLVRRIGHENLQLGQPVAAQLEGE